MTVRTLYSCTLAFGALPDAPIGERPIHPRGIRCGDLWCQQHRQWGKAVEWGMQNVIMMEADAFPIRVVHHLAARRTSIEVFASWRAGPVAFLRFQKIGRIACRPVAIGRNKIRRARTVRTGCGAATMEGRLRAVEIFAFAARFPS